MKSILITFVALFSISTQASSFESCEKKILTAIEKQIIASGDLIESEDGFSSHSITWQGDGFFDVYYQVWDKDPTQWPSHNTYEVVIGANCDIRFITLIDSSI